jgi:hypothetical protein
VDSLLRRTFIHRTTVSVKSNSQQTGSSQPLNSQLTTCLPPHPWHLLSFPPCLATKQFIWPGNHCIDGEEQTITRRGVWVISTYSSLACFRVYCAWPSATLSTLIPMCLGEWLFGWLFFSCANSVHSYAIKIRTTTLHK